MTCRLLHSGFGSSASPTTTSASSATKVSWALNTRYVHESLFDVLEDHWGPVLLCGRRWGQRWESRFPQTVWMRSQRRAPLLPPDAAKSILLTRANNMVHYHFSEGTFFTILFVYLMRFVNLQCCWCVCQSSFTYQDSSYSYHEDFVKVSESYERMGN